MDKSSRLDIPLTDQRRAWNKWNAETREIHVGTVPRRQADIVEKCIASLGRSDLSIIDVGCGTGWLCARLSQYGSVTGTDLADEVLQRAADRMPHVHFMAGDVMTLDLPTAAYDVAVTLEVLSRVVDQPAFMARLASLLKPGGMLILATQNRPVLERWSEIEGPTDGQVRRWVDAKQLRALLLPHFEVKRLTSIVPVGDQGLLRIVNAPKVNRLLELFVSAERIERAKECALLGHTLMAVARKPTPASTSDQ